MPQFSVTTRICLGKDTTKEASRHMKALALNKPIFIVDKNVQESKAFLRLVNDFEKEEIRVAGIEPVDASSEPTYEFVDMYADSLRKKTFVAIIAVGGGSVMDLAKGVGILLKNPGKAVEYRGMDKVKAQGIPVVCYPTTAGTGSEVTHTASFIDEASKTKLGINGRNVSSLFGVLMPELTFSCPREVTISSGLDAMLHAIEAASARTASAVTIMLGSHAFSLLYKNFRNVLREPDNYAAREGMLLGSYYAGVAMMNAGGGPASGISYPLGVHYKIPHGLAGGIFLPHIFEYNVSRGYSGYVEVYDHLPDSDASLKTADKSRDFVVKFRKFYNDIGAPKRLLGYGITKTDIGKLVNLTMEQRFDNLELNPLPFGRNELAHLLEKVI